MFIMSAMDTPWAFAVDVEAALVEWALNTFVSTPASFSSSVIHRAIEADVTGFQNEISEEQAPKDLLLSTWLFLLRAVVLPRGG